jgi:WD40 repeat protein
MLLPHQLGSAEMRERFRLEIRAVVGLEHPAILPVYQVGEYEGMPYFTMKLATGGTLASRLRQFQQQYREIAELMISLADAVHFAHERGALHRDLKPGNILFDEANRPYISDFGLAKFTENEGADAPAITHSIQLLGTPEFLPPEVAAGGVARATTAGDLYSLGAILYQLLTSRPPFTGAGLTTLLKSIVEQEPTRPTRLAASVPHDLEIICLKCLAKEPSERYASAREFAKDLCRWLSGRPILARPISIPARVRHWTRRNPALAAVSLLLAVAVVTAITLQVRTNRNLRRAFIDARLALQESLVAQAALKRASGGMGQRFGSIDLVTEAATLRPASTHPGLILALRTELAGALALPDLRARAKWPVYVAHFEGSAEFSRDLTKYVCAVKDGGLAVYATANQRLLRNIPAPKDNPAINFAFSPDGSWVGAGFQDGHAEVHSLSSSNPPLILPGQAALRTAIEFLPDNRSIVVADGSNGVFVFDLIDQSRHTLIAAPAVGFAMATDPLGGRLSVQIGDSLQVVRIADGSNVWSLPLSTGARCTEWSPDGNLLAVARGEPRFEIMILEAATAKLLYTFHDHDIGVGRLRFHPDGHSIVSTSWDGRLVWREIAPDGFRLVSDGGPRLLRFSPDGTQLAFEPSHGQAGIYEVAQSRVFKEWQRQTSPDEEAFTMCLSPDGRLAATSSARMVHLWDTSTGSELAGIPLPGRMWFVLLQFHPDGKSLLYSAVGIGIHQVDVALETAPVSGQRHVNFGPSRKLGTSDDLMALEFAPDGRSLIVGENKQSVKNERRSADIWLWPDGNPARARKLAGDWPLIGYHLTKDTRWGLTADPTEPDITVWDPAKGQRLKSLGFTEPVNFELTPDGRWLLASIRDSYQLVEIGSWQRAAQWPAEFGQQHYRCWSFSRDGSLVAVAAPNGRVDLRTLPDATELIQLPAPKSTQIRALQFSADATRLFLVTGAGSVQEWNLGELRRAMAPIGLDWKLAANGR